MDYSIFKIPMTISTHPGRIDSFFIQAISAYRKPIRKPNASKDPLEIEMTEAVKKGTNPINAAPIPAPKASSDKASPSKVASDAEIFPDLSTSAMDGVRKI